MDLESELKIVETGFKVDAVERKNGIVSVDLKKVAAEYRKENAKFVAAPYPSNEEVWKAFQELDEQYPGGHMPKKDDEPLNEIIYGWSRRVVDALCDHRFIHGWCGDTAEDFRTDVYVKFYEYFNDWKSGKHEQFHHCRWIHPNKISNYPGNLEMYCDFTDDDIKLYWHAFTRGPPLKYGEYKSIW